MIKFLLFSSWNSIAVAAFIAIYFQVMELLNDAIELNDENMSLLQAKWENVLVDSYVVRVLVDAGCFSSNRAG